jgi:hypothetical protein
MTIMDITLYDKEDVIKLTELSTIENKECTDLFFSIFDSAYRLYHLGDIYREVYPLSDDVNKVIESQMYEELLFLLEELKKFIDICNVPQETSDKLNEIIEKFGYLEYINLVAQSANLMVELYQILYRFYGKQNHKWKITIR